jgi:hypothetical protein
MLARRRDGVLADDADYPERKHQGNPLYFGLIWPAIVARGWQFVGAMAGDLM